MLLEINLWQCSKSHIDSSISVLLVIVTGRKGMPLPLTDLILHFHFLIKDSKCQKLGDIFKSEFITFICQRSHFCDMKYDIIALV